MANDLAADADSADRPSLCTAAERELLPGVHVPPLSLGGAMLGAVSNSEASAILRVAVGGGIKLVDTASAYGHSEERIGRGPPMLVATKYGAPCELNGHTRDFSAEACVAALNRSMENLRQQPIACLQLHSPPELPSPLHNSRLVNVLANAKAQGAISGWGASVHSMRGGHTALAAGADMLQLGFSVLSQELAPLLAQCAVARRGTLIQNVLCQGWLTETGVAAARLLLAAPRSTPRTAPTSYPMINFHGLLHAVLRLHTLAERCGSSVSELAIRFVLQTPGVSSALVQVRTASQLRGLLTPDVASPLPADVYADLVRIGASESADGLRMVHGEGTKLWHWGAPTPRWCIEQVVRAHRTPVDRMLRTALDDEAGHDLRTRFASDGFVKLEDAFPASLAASLAVAALDSPEAAAGAAYFRCKPAVELPPELARCAKLEAALSQLLGASLYSAHDRLASGFLATASESDEPTRRFQQHITVHREGSYHGPWRPSRSLPAHVLQQEGMEPEAEAQVRHNAISTGCCPPNSHLSSEVPTPIDVKGGWHIDFGNGHHRVDAENGAFDARAYMEAPWVVVLVCLTDVEPEGGPTVLVRGSHHAMANVLAALPPSYESSGVSALTVPRMFALCAALAAAYGPSRQERAVGRVGDVYLLHPLLVHAASVSRVGAAPRCILNVPHPFASAGIQQALGAISPVTLPVRHALAGRRLCPRWLLSMLLALVLRCFAISRELPRRRGRDAVAARAMEAVAGLAFACLHMATRARLLVPRCCCVRLFTAREWAAANEYVRLDVVSGTHLLAQLAEAGNGATRRLLGAVSAWRRTRRLASDPRERAELMSSPL